MLAQFYYFPAQRSIKMAMVQSEHKETPVNSEAGDLDCIQLDISHDNASKGFLLHASSGISYNFPLLTTKRDACLNALRDMDRFRGVMTCSFSPSLQTMGTLQKRLQHCQLKIDNLAIADADQQQKPTTVSSELWRFMLPHQKAAMQWVAKRLQLHRQVWTSNPHVAPFFYRITDKFGRPFLVNRLTLSAVPEAAAKYVTTSGVVFLPTGLGKTTVGAGIVQQLMAQDSEASSLFEAKVEEEPRKRRRVGGSLTLPVRVRYYDLTTREHRCVPTTRIETMLWEGRECLTVFEGGSTNVHHGREGRVPCCFVNAARAGKENERKKVVCNTRFSSLKRGTLKVEAPYLLLYPGNGVCQKQWADTLVRHGVVNSVKDVCHVTEKLIRCFSQLHTEEESGMALNYDGLRQVEALFQKYKVFGVSERCLSRPYYQAFLGNTHWRGVIIDEAQIVYTGATAAAKTIVQYMSADSMWLLTATLPANEKQMRYMARVLRLTAFSHWNHAPNMPYGTVSNVYDCQMMPYSLQQLELASQQLKERGIQLNSGVCPLLQDAVFGVGSTPASWHAWLSVPTAKLYSFAVPLAREQGALFAQLQEIMRQSETVMNSHTFIRLVWGIIHGSAFAHDQLRSLRQVLRQSTQERKEAESRFQETKAPPGLAEVLEDVECCSICTMPFSEMEDSDAVVQLPCHERHVFCLVCMQGWVATNPQKPCPYRCLGTGRRSTLPKYLLEDIRQQGRANSGAWVPRNANENDEKEVEEPAPDLTADDTDNFPAMWREAAADRIAAFLNEQSASQNIVMFCNSADAVNNLCDALRPAMEACDTEVRLIKANTQAKRVKALKKFQEQDARDHTVLVGSYRALAEGVDFCNVTCMFLVDMPLSARFLQQSIGRSTRLGSTQSQIPVYMCAPSALPMEVAVATLNEGNLLDAGSWDTAWRQVQEAMQQE